MATDLNAARDFLSNDGIAGWLTRDYRYTNPIFFAALGYTPPNLTRPAWLWIPADGEPRILAHDVDVNRFDQDVFEITVYSSRDAMLSELRSMLPDHGKIAMDYSPMYELPRVARVDAGSIELIRSFGLEVVPSADVSQYATERWSDAQLGIPPLRNVRNRQLNVRSLQFHQRECAMENLGTRRRRVHSGGDLTAPDSSRTKVP